MDKSKSCKQHNIIFVKATTVIEKRIKKHLSSPPDTTKSTTSSHVAWEGDITLSNDAKLWETFSWRFGASRAIFGTY